MSIPLTINGQVFEYPQNFDESWGVSATGWAQAVTAGALYLSGGNFPLTAAVDFGSSFGVKVLSVTSKTVNPASTGYLKLSKSDSIAFRNNNNNGNLLLAIDGSDNLTFNGSVLGTASLADGHIYVGNASNAPVAVLLSGDATLTNTGAMTIANSAITNAKVSASAAIATSKLAPLTVFRAIVSDSGGLLSASSVTSTELGYLSGVTSSVQTQIDAHLPLSGGTMSGTIAMGSHKITSLTAGASTGEALAFGQAFTAGKITFSPTTTGIQGTTTNDSAATGIVGEYAESIINGVSPTSGSYIDATSLTLTAGDWEVTAQFFYNPNGATYSGITLVGISQTSGNSGTGLVSGSNQFAWIVPNGAAQSSGSIANYRQSLSGPTTVYMKFRDNQLTGTPTLDGRLFARRIR